MTKHNQLQVGDVIYSTNLGAVGYILEVDDKNRQFTIKWINNSETYETVLSYSLYKIRLYKDKLWTHFPVKGKI